MKYATSYLSILFSILFLQSVYSQVPRVWIKSPKIINGMRLPVGANPAQLEIESQIYTGTSIPFGIKRPILRISNLFDLGNAVANPPDKEVLMIMQPNGYVGLGTDIPTSLFNLNGKFDRDHQLLTFSFLANDGKKWDYSSFGIEKASTFWVNNAQLRNGNHWYIDRGSYNAAASRISHGWDGIYFQYYVHDSNTQGAPFHDWKPFTSEWKSSLMITNTGQVRIGEKTLTSGNHQDCKLSVEGKAVFQEAIVTLSNWADFVFQEGYQLPELEEVESHIRENKKLPGFSSEEQMVENGMDVGSTVTLQQQKIEELFLYLIEMEKEMKSLKLQIKELQNVKKQ